MQPEADPAALSTQLGRLSVEKCLFFRVLMDYEKVL
jgi:hypothetical protein